MKNDTRPAPTNDPNAQTTLGHTTLGQATPRPRFLDPQEPRRVPLSQVRSDEEVRLAAEIEKLR